MQGFRWIDYNIVLLTNEKVPRLLANAVPRIQETPTPSDFVVSTYFMFESLTFANIDTIHISIPALSHVRPFRDLHSDLQYAISNKLVSRFILYSSLEEGADPQELVASMLSSRSIKTKVRVIVL